MTTVDGPDAGGVGTPIVEGLDVQPGSRLLGTVFPAPDTASTPDVRVALIEVEGDPADIARFYMEGLTALGYRFASTGCGDNGEVGPIIVCETPADPDTMADDWASMLLASPGDGPARFTTTIQLVIAPRAVPDDPAPGSSTLPRPPGTVITPAQAIDDIGGIEPVVVDPPGVGERIADASFDGGTGLVVEPGSQLLAPAVPLNAGLAGWSAVARVTGDPLEVADAYLAQREWDSTTPATRDDSDGPRITANASITYDAYLDLLLVPVGDDPDGDWWMLLTGTID